MEPLTKLLVILKLIAEIACAIGAFCLKPIKKDKPE